MSYLRRNWHIIPCLNGEDELLIGFMAPDGENGLEYTIPRSILDQFVLMRWAELTPSERLEIARRAVERNGGNVGCEALGKWLAKEDKHANRGAS